MNYRNVVFCALICLFLGSMESFAQQTINGSITSGGLTRDYILYVPASYSAGTAAPLVLNFHGYTSNAFEQMWYGDFRAIADTAGFILVHPEGTVDNTGEQHWNIGAGTSTVDDVAFTHDLIDSLSAQYSIDPNRIYSTGMSNGGFFSFKLACEMSPRIAAIASVTGSMILGATSTCTPTRPVPAMQIHGTSDPTVPYNGANWVESVPNVVSHWVSFDQCNSTPQVTNLPDINTSDGCTVEHSVYENGTNGSTVEHYKVVGGAHTWPGSAVTFPGTNYDMDASQEIWRFFSQFDLNGRIGMTNLEEPLKDELEIWPNPVLDFLRVRRENPEARDWEVLSLMGETLVSGTLQQQEEGIDLGMLPSGFYLFRSGETVRRIQVVD